MSLEIWLIIGIITVVYISWLVTEIHNAPLMPDDYDLSDKEKKETEELTKKRNLK